MSKQEMVQRLIEHSGLPVSAPQIPGRSLAEQIHALQRGTTEIALQAALHDILNCLESINSHYNSDDNPDRGAVARDLAYAMSGIQTMLVNGALTVGKAKNSSDPVLQMVLPALWAITFAWDAILAGDIVNLRQHLELEATARGVGIFGLGSSG